MLQILLSYVAAVVFLVAFVLGLRVTLRRVIEYRRDSDAVRVVVFGRLPIITIPYRTIVEISKVRSDEVVVPRRLVMFTAIRAGNRLSGDAVLIVRRKGLRRGVVLTPEGPDEFVADVRARVARRSTGGG